MKKLLCIACIILFMPHQKTTAQKALFGFTAGATLANMHSKVDNEKDNGDSKIGIGLGAFVDVPLSTHLSFQPGLQFIQKGTKDNSDGIKIKMNLNYLELPLNLLYNSNRSGGNFFIGAGPSVAVGLSGNITVELEGEKESEKVHFGNSESDDLKRLDLGANLLAGYCAKNGVRIALNYNYGLSNLFPGGTEDGKLRNNYFGIGVGFMLGK